VATSCSSATSNAARSSRLANLKPAEARQLLAQWIIEDSATVEERRAALGALVERVEFDPATGAGRVQYRIGLNGMRFEFDPAARELALPGYSGRPHGDSNPGIAVKGRCSLQWRGARQVLVRVVER
jgi:hypothetical protein